MTPDVPDVLVRPLVGADRDAWAALWTAYLEFYEQDVEEETTDVVFQRLTDTGWPSQRGWVAEVEGAVLGFVHVVLHPSTWSTALDCYLEDLFTAPAARGNGIGTALVGHVAAAGREAGWRRVHWLTERDNATARRLYDELAEPTDQVRYTIEL